MKEDKIAKNKIVRLILIILGFISVFLGILGFVLPILPTTPFLLLAVALFARSSNKFHGWMLNNKWFGKILKDYYDGKGVTVKIKFFAITILWITIIVTIVFALKLFWVRLLLIVIATIVSIYIISLPVKYRQKE